MYVNDLPLCTEFSVTLFADDTYLMHSDKRIDYPEQKVSAELAKIGCWLRTFKLTLNYTKTNYMLINRVFGFNNSDFEVQIGHSVISRVSFVKYLQVYVLMINKLSRSSHINQVARKLSKCNGIIYKLRKYVNREALLVLYYSLGYSHLQYGITVWDDCYKITIAQDKSWTKQHL